MLPVFYFAAAGASLLGGAGSSWYLWDRGKQAAARELAKEDLRNVEELLRQEINLQALRDEAMRRGVDPDAVLRGYEDLKRRQPDLQQLAEQFNQFMGELESGDD